MNADVKAKWVAALRSGDYKQGTLRLRGQDDTFCCLGVLCELAVAEGIISPPSLPDDYACWAYAGDCTTNLPTAVQVWSGLSAPLGDCVAIDGVTDALAFQNDRRHHTFPMLADAIEAQL